MRTLLLLLTFVVTLPETLLVYGTYGKLNAAKDNVVLLPSMPLKKS